jgi:hypothetical protein
LLAAKDQPHATPKHAAAQQDESRQQLAFFQEMWLS